MPNQLHIPTCKVVMKQAEPIERKAVVAKVRHKREPERKLIVTVRQAEPEERKVIVRAHAPKR